MSLFDNETIPEFQGEYRWLSNFWPAQVKLEGFVFPTVENAYQAAKTGFIYTTFLTCSAAEAKKQARTFKMVENWDQKKVDVMRILIKQKFAPGTQLAAKLEATGDKLIIEGNNWGDTFWGAVDGKGKNTLGQLIMEARKENRLTKSIQDDWQLAL